MPETDTPRDWGQVALQVAMWSFLGWYFWRAAVPGPWKIALRADVERVLHLQARIKLEAARSEMERDMAFLIDVGHVPSWWRRAALDDAA